MDERNVANDRTKQTDSSGVAVESVDFRGAQLEHADKVRPSTNRTSAIRRYRDGDGWLWTEVAVALIGLVFLIPTAVMMWLDLNDRREERVSREEGRVTAAWEHVTRHAPGNSGKGQALEYLVRQGIPLMGIDLSAASNNGSVHLESVDLSGAVFENANLSGVIMKRVNLSGANLERANFSGADLWKTDLSQSNIEEANFRGASLNQVDLRGADFEQVVFSDSKLDNMDLSGENLYKVRFSGALLEDVDLTGAIFDRVDLSGADLSWATGLTQQQLSTSCGNSDTELPSTYLVRGCPVD